jgi:hypothetical protein
LAHIAVHKVTLAGDLVFHFDRSVRPKCLVVTMTIDLPSVQIF